MRQAPLFALLISTIEAGLQAQGLTLADAEGAGGIVVQQGYQPVEEGTPTQPMVALHAIGSRRYGYLKRSDVWVPPEGANDGYMAHEERQWVESTYQITALAPQNPKLLNQMAASDLAMAAADALQSDAGREMLRKQGVGVLRITDIRMAPFSDDRDRYEYAPNFDFTVTHENVRLSTNPAVDKFKFNLERV